MATTCHDPPSTVLGCVDAGKGGVPLVQEQEGGHLKAGMVTVASWHPFHRDGGTAEIISMFKI